MAGADDSVLSAVITEVSGKVSTISEVGAMGVSMTAPPTLGTIVQQEQTDLNVNMRRALSTWSQNYGTSPYINASDSSYIGTENYGSEDKEYEFEKLGTSLPLKSVVVYISGRNMYPGTGPVDVDLYLYIGVEWVKVGSVEFTEYTYEYKSIDVSSFLDTINKINEVKASFVRGVLPGAPYYVAVRLDHCYIRVMQETEYVDLFVVDPVHYMTYMPNGFCDIFNGFRGAQRITLTEPTIISHIGLLLMAQWQSQLRPKPLHRVVDVYLRTALDGEIVAHGTCYLDDDSLWNFDIYKRDDWTYVNFGILLLTPGTYYIQVECNEATSGDDDDWVAWWCRSTMNNYTYGEAWIRYGDWVPPEWTQFWDDGTDFDFKLVRENKIHTEAVVEDQTLVEVV